ncbi:MAG: T9SS type A sorting domain-containing protein [Saprospiraceae bacterium]|nr:T9SS type A sorting domain-containing protein [Saprospiraceae bacterium]
MKSIYSIVAATFCALSPLFAQAPAIEWQNTIGGSASDVLNSIKQTADGGYILGGWSESDISGDKTENSHGDSDYWAVKLDATGAIQWQNTIGGNNRDFVQSLQQTADGGYILGGSSESNISGDKTENSNGGRDCWVVKLDATGAIQWQNTIGGSDDDYLHTLQQTADGGYVLGGYSESNISGDKTENSNGNYDYWVVKLNATGAIQWQNTIGGNDPDLLYSLQQTADGGYILGGGSTSDISGDKTENGIGGGDYWVLKLDATGAIQWQNTIGGNDDDAFISLQQTADGGYILGGWSYSNISGDKTENGNGSSDFWVVKLNAAGAIQWQNTIGGNGDDELSSLQQTADGGYFLGGSSDSNISGDKTENRLGMDDYWVVKLDATGGVQWQNTIGGSSYDGLISLQQTVDGGYILGGYSDSNISGDKTEDSNGGSDYWVIKLAPETVPTKDAPTTLIGIIIYPNPTTDILFVRSETPTTLCLHNTIGQILSTQTIQGQDEIDLSRYPNGIYFLVEMETGIGHKILKNE